MDSAYFFHPDGERGPARARREAKAKEVCQHCPVLYIYCIGLAVFGYQTNVSISTIFIVDLLKERLQF